MPEIPNVSFRELVYSTRELEDAAAHYYQCEASAVLPVSGSQQAIALLPLLSKNSSIAIPQVGYREHYDAWAKLGHQCLFYGSLSELKKLVDEQKVEHGLVINPNNPSAEIYNRDSLIEIADKLEKRGGFLLVDEAFVDAAEHLSLTSFCPHPGLVVLRSMGKFFGLAGLRLGFVVSEPKIKERLVEMMPLWSISGVASWVGKEALCDTNWQLQQRSRLLDESVQWCQQLQDWFPSFSWHGTSLFATGYGREDECSELYTQLGERGVLIRLFRTDEGLSAVRLGLLSKDTKSEFLRRIENLQSQSINKEMKNGYYDYQ